MPRSAIRSHRGEPTGGSASALPMSQNMPDALSGFAETQGLMGVLRQADDWRQGRLVSSEYDETTWAARNYMAFAAQRISVAAQISMAQEIAEALGLSVAADPRA